MPPLPLWPQLSTWLQILEGHGGYTRGCSTLTRGWPQYPSNPALEPPHQCARRRAVCAENCTAAARPLNLANVCCAARPALCNCTPRCAGLGTPAAAPGRGTLASFARPRPRGICKLCRVTPARPAAHCKAVQKFAQLPHIPRRPVNPHTAAPKPCNRDSQAGDSCTHTHTSLVWNQ